MGEDQDRIAPGKNRQRRVRGPPATPTPSPQVHQQIPILGRASSHTFTCQQVVQQKGSLITESPSSKGESKPVGRHGTATSSNTLHMPRVTSLTLIHP